MLYLTLRPMSALPCQINQVSDSSQPNDCILLLISGHCAVEVNTNLVELSFFLSHRSELLSDGQSIKINFNNSTVPRTLGVRDGPLLFLVGGIAIGKNLSA